MADSELLPIAAQRKALDDKIGALACLSSIVSLAKREGVAPPDEADLIQARLAAFASEIEQERKKIWRLGS